MLQTVGFSGHNLHELAENDRQKERESEEEAVVNETADEREGEYSDEGAGTWLR